jgi:hypothetical protein
MAEITDLKWKFKTWEDYIPKVKNQLVIGLSTLVVAYVVLTIMCFRDPETSAFFIFGLLLLNFMGLWFQTGIEKRAKRMFMGREHCNNCSYAKALGLEEYWWD